MVTDLDSCLETSLNFELFIYGFKSKHCILKYLVLFTYFKFDHWNHLLPFLGCILLSNALPQSIERCSESKLAWNLKYRYEIQCFFKKRATLTKARCNRATSCRQHQKSSKGNGFASPTELKCWKLRKEWDRCNKQHYLSPGFYSFWKSTFSEGRPGQWAPALISKSLCQCWRASKHAHSWWGISEDTVLLLAMDISAEFCRPLFLHEKRMQRNFKGWSSSFSVLIGYAVWTARQSS